MNELALVAAFAVGVALGAAYFWALWLTVSALDRSIRPAVRITSSLVLRFALVLGGFYLVTRYGGWQWLLAATAGFLLPRFILVRRLGSSREPGGGPP